LYVDLSDVPEQEFVPLWTPQGRPYKRLDYDVEMSLQSSLEFSVSVKGKKYGAVTAKYEV
jgi:hypothetical protein